MHGSITPMFAFCYFDIHDVPKRIESEDDLKKLQLAVSNKDPSRFIPLYCFLEQRLKGNKWHVKWRSTIPDEKI